MIEPVDGKPIADGRRSREGWTPVTLPEYLRKAAIEGREVEFTVAPASERRESDGED